MDKEIKRYINEWNGKLTRKELLYNAVKFLYKTVISCGGDGWGVFVCEYVAPDEVINAIKDLDYLFEEIPNMAKSAWRFIGEGRQGIFVITKKQFEADYALAIRHADSGLVIL